MNDRVPLDNAESEYASWLATLNDSKSSPPIRALAVKRLAEMFMGARIEGADQQKQLQAQRIRIETLEKEAAEDARVRRAIAALAVPNGVVLMPRVQTPGQPALRVVPKEGT